MVIGMFVLHLEACAVCAGSLQCIFNYAMYLCACRGGAVVLQAGERVGVAEIGILATVGAVKLPVHRRPKVAVLSTGMTKLYACFALTVGVLRLRLTLSRQQAWTCAHPYQTCVSGHLHHTLNACAAQVEVHRPQMRAVLNKAHKCNQIALHVCCR